MLNCRPIKRSDAYSTAPYNHTLLAMTQASTPLSIGHLLLAGYKHTHYDHLQFHASRIQYIDDRALTNSYLAYTRSELVEHHVDSAFESISLVKKIRHSIHQLSYSSCLFFYFSFELKINLHHCCLSIMQCSHVTTMRSSK